MKFIKAHDTLNKILEITNNKKRGWYLRVGDGDVFLAYGQRAGWQTGNEKIKKECQEALQIPGNNSNSGVIKTFSAECPEYGIEDWWGRPVGVQSSTFLNTDNQTSFVHKIMKMANPFWHEDMNRKNALVYSANAFWITCCYDLPFWLKFVKEFRKNFDKIIHIGNENYDTSVLKLIWNKEFSHVDMPSRDAYSNIDEAEKETNELLSEIKDTDYTLIVLECGPTGRCLGKRIWKNTKYNSKNIFLFDFGSLMDALHNRKTRGWIRKEHLDVSLVFKELSKINSN